MRKASLVRSLLPFWLIDHLLFHVGCLWSALQKALAMPFQRISVSQAKLRWRWAIKKLAFARKSKEAIPVLTNPLNAFLQKKTPTLEERETQQGPPIREDTSPLATQPASRTSLSPAAQILDDNTADDVIFLYARRKQQPMSDMAESDDVIFLGEFPIERPVIETVYISWTLF